MGSNPANVVGSSHDVLACTGLTANRHSPAPRRRRSSDVLVVLFDIMRHSVKPTLRSPAYSVLARFGAILGARSARSTRQCVLSYTPVREKKAVKIVILDGRPLAPDRAAWSGLDRFGAVEYHDFTPPEEVPVRARGADVLVTNKAPIRKPFIATAGELRFVTVTATGFDCVDVAAAREKAVPVSNVPIYSTRSVAQFVFALLLELCQNVARHAEAVGAGEWSNQPDFALRKTPLFELAGKTMGIVGLGRIGQQVGEIAQAFGMKVIASQSSRPAPASGGSSIERRDLDVVFAQSDVISLHCPLTPQTAGLVNRERLARMKPGAFLINTARGALVVEEDLADALNAGRLAGAGIDVVSREPIRPENPLRGAKNCLITPHIAWATEEARARLMEATVANVAAYVAGSPVNVVN
jgi:glycerate dehydrogenase